MSEEIWKPVVGYEGYYEVSNKGRVKGIERYANVCGGGKRLVKEKIRSHFVDIGGYLKVNLSKEGKNKQAMVHRLVAEAFIPNPDNLPEVNHKDENRQNDCVENLEWCDKSYNQLYSLALHPERAYVFGNNFKDKATGESLSPWTKPNIPHKHFNPVEQRTFDGEIIARFDNPTDAHHKTGFDGGLITKCCNGIYKQAYGYKWAWAL